MIIIASIIISVLIGIILATSFVGMINPNLPTIWYNIIRTKQIILFIVLRKLIKGEYK